jgi:hypothetical protein
VNRRSGLAVSMFVMSLWMGQAALGESGLSSVALGVATLALTCLGGALIFGFYEPEAIPEEELSPLRSRFLLAMLLIGVGVSLLLFFL